MIKYFSKRPSSTNVKRFSEDASMDLSIVKTLCNVVDGLQGKVAEMANELAALKEKSSGVVQNASTEEGEVIAEPRGNPIQEPEQIPESVANGVANDPEPQYTQVPEVEVVSQFSKGKETTASPKFMMGQESFKCLFN